MNPSTPGTDPDRSRTDQPSYSSQADTRESGTVDGGTTETTDTTTRARGADEVDRRHPRATGQGERDRGVDSGDPPRARAVDSGKGPPDGGGLSRRELLGSTAAAGGLIGLSGCIYLESTPAGKTVVQLAADSGTAAAESTVNKALHEAGLPEDIQVDVIVTNSGNASSQFTQWISAGIEQPSLLRMDSGWTIPFIARNQVGNLTEKLPDVAEKVKSEYFEATVETITSPEGDVFGVPMFSDFGLMLYRKDLVEKAGFDPSGWATSPLSWKKFSEVTAKTKEEAGTKYGFSFQADIYEGLSCCTFNEIMTTWGGSYFGARENLLENVGNRPVTVNSEPVKKALGMAKAFIQGTDSEGALDEVTGSICPSAVLAWQEDSSLSAFMDENAVTHRNWPYSILEGGGEDGFGKDLGVMPMPYGVEKGSAEFDGMGGSKSALGGWHVTLNPNAKHEEAALEVLKAMTKDSYYLAQMQELGFVPPKPDLLDSDKVREIEVIGRYADQLKYAGNHAIPRPVTVLWPLQSPRISQQVSAAMSGDKPIDRAMSDLERILKQTEKNAEKQQ